MLQGLVKEGRERRGDPGRPPWDPPGRKISVGGEEQGPDGRERDALAHDPLGPPHHGPAQPQEVDPEADGRLEDDGDAQVDGEKQHGQDDHLSVEDLAPNDAPVLADVEDLPQHRPYATHEARGEPNEEQSTQNGETRAALQHLRHQAADQP